MLDLLYRILELIKWNNRCEISFSWVELKKRKQEEGNTIVGTDRGERKEWSIACVYERDSNKYHQWPYFKKKIATYSLQDLSMAQVFLLIPPSLPFFPFSFFLVSFPLPPFLSLLNWVIMLLMIKEKSIIYLARIMWLSVLGIYIYW